MRYKVMWWDSGDPSSWCVHYTNSRRAAESWASYVQTKGKAGAIWERSVS